MQESKFKIYPYRWVMLSVYMVIVAINQLLWITFAPITTDATLFFGVSDIKIGILSMCFMIVFIIFSLPASWVIDTYGLRIGVGIGAVFTGAFGLMRGLVSDNYTLVLIAQIGIAIGQPFIMNATTKLAARWFPIEERATASGLGTLAMYIGVLAGMVLTPYLAIGSGIGGVLFIYGIVSIAGALIFLIFSKERPVTAPCLPHEEERLLALDGLKKILTSKNFILLLIIFFIGLGVFNSVTTWIENILKPRGFSATQAGVTGGVMIAAGILGALVIPIFSDRYQMRARFIIIALIGATIGLIGITFTGNFPILLVSGAILGFFLLSSGPIGFQYGAEITYPASEGSSNGLLLMIGQISGIALIFGMDSFKSADTGSMDKSMILLIILMIISIVVSFFLKESPMMAKKKDDATKD